MKQRTYHPGHFLADRLPFILTFLASSACISTVAVLGIATRKESERSGNIVYLFILTLCFAVAALVIDYLRQAAFYRRAEALLESHSLDAMALLGPGVTREQQMLIRAMEQQYGKYKALLEQYQAAEERRRHFTNQWVHQIKTPVSVIDLLTQQMDSASGEEQLTGRLLSIREENTRISGYLELVLHDARLDRFETDVRARLIPLLPLLRKAVNRHKTSLIQTQIYPSITGEDVQVVTDGKWLDFVLNQLLSNAIKYSRLGDGSKQLHIHIDHRPEETLLSITDQGIGIPEQDLARVTEAFFTGENGRRTKESTGMGLYLAHEVCRRLGHPLDIRSGVGKGTTVTIRFTDRSFYRL